MAKGFSTKYLNCGGLPASIAYLEREIARVEAKMADLDTTSALYGTYAYTVRNMRANLEIDRQRLEKIRSREVTA